jgi:hypothetical protein
MRNAILLLCLVGCGEEPVVSPDLLMMAVPPDLSMTTTEPDLSTVSTDMAGAPMKYSVTLTLNGFALHQGQKFTLWIKEGTTLVGMGEIASLTNAASQMLTVSNVVEAGKTYNLDYWVDYNDNGVCDTQPTDHSWRNSTGVISGNFSFTKTHDTNWTTICP